MKGIRFRIAVSMYAIAALTSVAAAQVGDRLHWMDGYVDYDVSGPFVTYNRLAGSDQIIKPQNTIGQYKVKFNGLSSLGSKSIVQTTSTVNGPLGFFGLNYCSPSQPTLVRDAVNVRCFDATTGLPADADYYVSVTRNQPDNAFAYANQPTGTDYAPPANASWNPAGGAIRVFRNGVGLYQVAFYGLGNLTANDGGNFQAVSVGTSGSYCNIQQWYGSPDLSVWVSCFSGTGAPMDTAFNVLFQLPSPYVSFLWADNPTATSTYTPNTYYSSSNGTLTITRYSTGFYVVATSATLLDLGTAMITSYGGNNTHCMFYASFLPFVRIQCFDTAGNPADALFSLMFGS